MQNGKTTSIKPPALKVEGIRKRFGDLEVLKGISLTAEQGDVISLIGSSGSGKSTLLRCINLLETPNAGRVWLNGELIEMTVNRKGENVPKSNRQVDRIRTKLGMVFQQFNLWAHMSIIENVIEAPVHVLESPRRRPKKRPWNCWKKSVLRTRPSVIPSSFPAVSSNGPPSPAPWPWSRR